MYGYYYTHHSAHNQKTSKCTHTTTTPPYLLTKTDGDESDRNRNEEMATKI